MHPIFRAQGGGGVNSSLSSDDLFNDILGGDAEFQLFDASSFVDYSLRYAGIDSFLTYDVRMDPAGGVTGLLRSDLSGIDETFLGFSRDEVDDQMEEYLKSGGWSKLLRAAQRNSLVAVSDGNPNASTALMANQAFDDGLDATGPENDSGGGVELAADFRRFDAGGFEGSTFQLPLKFRIPLGARLNGLLRVPLAYTEIGDAKAYHLGTHLTVPIPVYSDDARHWVLSPAVGVAGSFSEEFISGSALWTAGLTSNFRWDFGKFRLTMGNHFSFYEGIDLEVDGYEAGAEVSQQIVKNGLKASIPLGSSRWEAEPYTIHTAFLSEAAVEDYWTVGFQLTKDFENRGGRVSVRVEGEYGDDYDSLGVKFGGGFKF